MTTETGDLDALRVELFDLYDAMIDARAKYVHLDQANERGEATHAEAMAAHCELLDAQSALHDRINRIGRDVATPTGEAAADSPVPAVGDAGAGVPSS